MMSLATTNASEASTLPRGWLLVPLEQLIAPVAHAITDGPFGSNLKSAHYTDSGPRVIRLQNIGDGVFKDEEARISPERYELLRKHAVSPGNIAMALLGEVLPRACIVPDWLGLAIVKADCVKIVLDESVVDSRFVCTALNSQQVRSRTSKLIKGIGRPRLNLRQARQITVPIAPRPEQVRIADRIDELFTELSAGVAALERVRRKLKRYRSAVLHAAVTGKLTTKWRKEHGHPVEPGDKLLARILIERRKQWEARTLAKYDEDGRQPPKNWRDRYPSPVEPKTDDLPELPEGWCWGTLDQAFLVVRNGTAIVPRSVSGVRILRISAVRPLRVDLSDVRYLTEIEANSADAWLENGDLLFTRYNGSARLCGVCGRVEALDTPTVHPDKLIKCQVTANTIDSAYIEIASNAGSTRSIIESRLRTTAGQVGVSGSDIKATPFPMPPLTEQQAIVEKVQEELSQIDAMEAEVKRGLARASRLRQAILKSAFSGKLVPQDPTDEPAAVLLERIKAERAQQHAASNGRVKWTTSKKAVRKRSPANASRAAKPSGKKKQK